MRIKVDDISSPLVQKLLTEHMDDMLSLSLPESRRAFDLEGLKTSDVTFWSVWDGDRLAGCGAIKELDPKHAEIKSMRTAEDYRSKGVGARILKHIIDVAGSRGYERLSLEAGTMDYFKPAHNLYEKYGFQYSEPFGEYARDQDSVFMTKELEK